MQNKTILGLLLLGTIGMSQAFATDYGDQSHSQGNSYQCATGPTQQLECQIMNVLTDLLPKMLSQMQQTNVNLQSEIADQKIIIQNQQQEIQLLNQLVPHDTTLQNCHKSGTGVICG